MSNLRIGLSSPEIFYISGGKASTTTPTPTESDTEEITPRRGRSGRATRTSEMNGNVPSESKEEVKEVRNNFLAIHAW